TETKSIAATKTEKAGTEQLITYRVDRGARHRLIGIAIAGNRYFDSDLLRSRLLIYGSAFGSRGRFSRRLVDADAASMKALYMSNGFLDAKVEAVADDNYKGHVGDLFVRFTVDEGKQTRVASLSIEGAHAFKQEDLLNVIGSTPGQPYSDLTVTTDRGNVLALYFNEGFPEASFSATAESAGTTPPSAKPGVGETGKRRQITYTLQEGPQTGVRSVFLGGYKHTRPGVTRREVLVRPSEPLRQGDVVESQRRLYNLGVFNRVTIEPQNSSGSDPDKNVVVLVEE